MCGIAGIWSTRGLLNSRLRRLVGSMADAIAHRGPDGYGVWTDNENGVALAHRRLAILDLSPAGDQPMQDTSGRFVIAFNGEIYNHLDLRRSLGDKGAAPAWRGHSDTETLLAAIMAWGVKGTLERVCGMFAFALWDRSARTLTLARDRLGEKPLYYGWSNGVLLFGSELEALTAYPGFDNAIDREAIAAFLRFSYVPEPATIFRRVRKLPPGHLVLLMSASDEPAPQAYWRLETVALEGSDKRLEDDYSVLCDQVESCLKEVVASQMLSDVPLGCFLSGGIDFSLVAALMQGASRQKIRTFTMGFDDHRFNEADHARQVAAHLGTEHTEFIVTEADALSVVSDLPKIYGEPFADPSQIPTILLSRLTRQHVTVALSGDGGDEVFGGYNRYTFAPDLWRLAAAMPGVCRRVAGHAITALQSAAINERSLLRSCAGHLGLPVTTIDKLSKFGGAIGRAEDFKGLYHEIVSTFPDPSAVLLEPGAAAQGAHLSSAADMLLGHEEWMMATDTVTYLPGDILVKVDRAAMSASLETRAPFLDRRVVELAWRLPLAAKIRGRTRQARSPGYSLSRCPSQFAGAPQTGLRDSARPMVAGRSARLGDNFLSTKQIVATGVFDARKVEVLWRDHQSKKGRQCRLATLDDPHDAILASPLQLETEHPCGNAVRHPTRA